MGAQPPQIGQMLGLADVPGPLRVLTVVRMLDDFRERGIAGEKKDLRAYVARESDRFVEQDPVGIRAVGDHQDRSELVHVNPPRLRLDRFAEYAATETV